MIQSVEFERPLKWSDAFSVGHALLDHEIRGLLASVNNFRMIGSTRNFELRCVLFHSLTLFAQQHFEHEENILREALSGKFPVQTLIETRIGIHEIALVRLSAIGSAIAKAPVNEMPAHYTALKLWFMEHVLGHNPHQNGI